MRRQQLDDLDIPKPPQHLVGYFDTIAHVSIVDKNQSIVWMCGRDKCNAHVFQERLPRLIRAPGSAAVMVKIPRANCSECMR